MGILSDLFGGDETTQNTTQNVDSTEIGISDVDGVGYVGGNFTSLDGGAIENAFDFGEISLDGIQSIASDALDSQERLAMGALLATGAGFEQANRLAEQALFRVAESKNPNAAEPAALSQSNIENLIKFGALAGVALAIAWYMK